MKKFLAGVALVCSLALASPAVAADYSIIMLNIAVNRPAAEVWAKVGDYCAIAQGLKVTCAYTSGSGDVGTVRKLNGATEEIMVAKTLYSYTYTQPASTILYHGTLEVQPVDAQNSKIVYTLLYDQEPLGTPAAKEANRKQRAARFQTAIETMKAIAEAS
jgi:hypothetical protein